MNSEEPIVPGRNVRIPIRTDNEMARRQYHNGTDMPSE